MHTAVTYTVTVTLGQALGLLVFVLTAWTIDLWRCSRAGQREKAAFEAVLTVQSDTGGAQ